MSIVPMHPKLSTSTLDIKDQVLELAEVISNTDFVPRGLRGNPPAILAAILYGHEVGLGPMQSLENIAVIDGRPSMSVVAMRGLILAAGHELLTEESTVTKATVAGRRRDSRQTVRKTWTIDDARRAKIAGRTNWQNYPRQMLVARATGELARELFADVIGGFLAIEEAEDMEPVEESPKQRRAPAEKPGTQRRSRTLVASTPPVVMRPVVEVPPLPDDTPDWPGEPPPAPPEEPPPPPEPEPARASDAQRRKMHASFRDAGIEERDARIAYIERIVGRPVASSADLDQAEISAVIDALKTEPTISERRETHEATQSRESHALNPQEPGSSGLSTFAIPLASQTQKDKLDDLTTELLSVNVIGIQDLWRPVAAYRKTEYRALVEELGGEQEGRLWWQPLRESLSAAEASDLIELLEETRRASSLFDVDG